MDVLLLAVCVDVDVLLLVVCDGVDVAYCAHWWCVVAVAVRWSVS